MPSPSASKKKRKKKKEKKGRKVRTAGQQTPSDGVSEEVAAATSTTAAESAEDSGSALVCGTVTEGDESDGDDSAAAPSSPTRAPFHNQPKAKICFGGVLMEREKALKLLETHGEVDGRSSAASVKSHEDRVIASAKTDCIYTGLRQRRERFKRAEAGRHQHLEKETSDYNLYLSHVEERLFAEREDIQRRFTVTQALVKVATRNGQNARANKFQAQLDKVHERNKHFNENVTTLKQYKEELHSSPTFARLQKWVSDKYSFLGSSKQLAARDDLEEDERMWSFDRLAEQLKIEEQEHQQQQMMAQDPQDPQPEKKPEKEKQAQAEQNDRSGPGGIQYVGSI